MAFLMICEADCTTPEVTRQAGFSLIFQRFSASDIRISEDCKFTKPRKYDKYDTDITRIPNGADYDG